LLHKVTGADPEVLPVSRLLALATGDAATILNLGDRVGSLAAGKRADVITVQRAAAHLEPWHDPQAGLVYAARGLDVQEVWLDGQLRVRDGRLLAGDVAEAMDRAAAWAARHAAALFPRSFP
jgi:5-methylthioadenosine/S-adenosylhomocysteine deaminase